MTRLRARRALIPWACAAALALAIVALPMTVLIAAGALDVPWADDWAFERVAASLEHTGHLQLIGWGDATLVGHLGWGVPWIAALGSGMESVHWAGAAAALIGLLAAFALFRQFLSLPWALLGIAAVGLSPLYALLTGTYMSDIPAFATEMGCLALGVAGLRTTDRRWLKIGAALAVGAVGFTIRESTLFAPAAVLLGAFIASDSKRERVRVVVAAAVFALLVTAFYRWRQGLESPTFARTPHFILTRDVVTACKALMLVSIIALPASIAVLAGRWRRPASRAALLGLAASFTAAIVPLSQAYYYDENASLFPGNLLAEKGALGDGVLSGTRADLFPTAAWIPIELMAVVSGSVLLGVFVRAVGRRAELSPRAWVIGAYLAGTLVAFATRADTRAPVYDRYILGTTAIGALAVLAGQPRAARRVDRSFVAGALALVVPAIVSFLLVQDSAAYSSARWQAGERAVAAGTPPDSVDAGFEWAGYHTRGAIGHASRAPGASHAAFRGIAGQYTGELGNIPCVVIADTRKSGFPLVRVDRYRSVGGFVTRHLYTYRILARCPRVGGA